MPIDPAERRTPAAVRKELTRFGGTNPYGGPNWRVVLASEVFVKRGGVFKTMPSGDVKTVEIDPKTYRTYYNEVKPERVVTGIREIPRYHCKGWVLERWFPVSKVGKSRSEWEAAKSSDGITPMMGPFPSEGFYFMLGGPWEHLPELADLKLAISMRIRTEETNPVSYGQMMLEEIGAEQAAQEAQMLKYDEDMAYFYKSEVETVLKGTSLSAQRIRTDLQNMMGERSHLGVA